MLPLHFFKTTVHISLLLHLSKHQITCNTHYFLTTSNMAKLILPLFLNLFVILGAASPAVPRDSSSCSGQYRCKDNLSGIEICDLHGWHTAATCKNATCIINVGNGIPYCNDP
ncbi:hypothetical protein PMIN06_006795 [Paraphaeosphaeria minitans]